MNRGFVHADVGPVESASPTPDRQRPTPPPPAESGTHAGQNPGPSMIGDKNRRQHPPTSFVAPPRAGALGPTELRSEVALPRNRDVVLVRIVASVTLDQQFAEFLPVWPGWPAEQSKIRSSGSVRMPSLATDQLSRGLKLHRIGPGIDQTQVLAGHH